MAIDLVAETTIPLKEAANVLPRRNGKKINFSTLWRWAFRGIRGTRLEVLRIGGTLYTSTEALQRFAEATTTGRPAVTRTSKRRQRDHARADRELSEAGY